MRFRNTAIRLISSEIPCRKSRANPIRIRDFAGHCGRPPAFIDCSLSANDRRKKGTDVTIITIVNGNRKKRWPKTSMMSRARLGSIPLTMSIRMCSLDKSVHGEHKRNIAPNRTHCNSSQAFDEVSKILRIVALVAETITTIRISQDKALPILKLSASMMRLSLSKPATRDPPRCTPDFGAERLLGCRLRGLAPGQVAGRGP